MPAIWKRAGPDDPMYKEGWQRFYPNWGPKSIGLTKTLLPNTAGPQTPPQDSGPNPPISNTKPTSGK